MFFDSHSDVVIQNDDARYLKRKVKGGNVDVHPNEKAIIVNYEVEATILGELGDPMLGEKKLSQKVIRLDGLSSNTDISALATEIIEQCKLIHVSKLPEVEQLLYYLQNRKQNQVSAPDKSGKQKKTFGLQDPIPDLVNELSQGEKANINNIDDYVELLYEDIPAKIKGSSLLLRLTRNPDNLEELYQHETVLGALTRVLREDWKKSVELSTNIMYIFFCFSSYTQFHSIVAKYKIGALCMMIIQHELDRYDTWKEDIDKKKAISNSENSDIKEYEKIYRKFVNLVKKQNQLLRVGFYLLLNLSEDTLVEVKMKNKGIVSLLLKTLETRKNPDLILLVLSFLKKLSIFLENKNEMKKQDIISKLSPLIGVENGEIKSLVLRLLLNLSFDPNLRKQMVENGFLPKITTMLNFESNRTAVLCLLYHLSIDQKARSLFSYTDCIPELITIILNYPPGQISIEAAALCINLATKSKNAELICNLDNGKSLKYLVKRAFKFKDGLIFKIIRNLSRHSGSTLEKFIEFAGLFARAITTEQDEDLVIEFLGILSNLNHPDVDYNIILSKYNLMPFIKKALVPDQVEDDLVLECVVLLGTLAFDSNCSSHLASLGIIQLLIDLLNAKQEDDELVLQIVFVFHQLVYHEVTRNLIVSETQVPAYLIDLMHDRNSEIRQMCDCTLDLIKEHDGDWAKRIKLEKFQWHNSQWVEMIETQHHDIDDRDEVYDDILTPYLADGDLLYEPNFESNLLVDDMGMPSMYIDDETLRNKIASGQLVPSGYVGDYIDPSDDPRFLL